MFPRWSPDGAWVAFGTMRGRWELARRRTDGSAPPETIAPGEWWLSGNPRGGELFYLQSDAASDRVRMMSVTVQADRVGMPRVLFVQPSNVGARCTPNPCYDVSPDGRTFYGVRFNEPLRAPPVTHIELVLNWRAEMEAKLAMARTASR